MTLRNAVSKINQKGIILVFPINNLKDPPSLWCEFFPRSRMRWEWSEAGDGRVAGLWHLREQLSDSGLVIYSKWYKGRATFFSKPIFASMLATQLSHHRKGLLPEAHQILEVLTESSPLSTKELKRAANLEGKFNEGTYTRAIKQLFSRLLVVGYGEIDDGAFPSLAIGATELLFEETWDEARGLALPEAERRFFKAFPEASPFRKEYDRLRFRARLSE